MDRRSRGSSRRPSRSASDLAQLRAGRLRIGTFPTVGASLLPLAVTDFRDRYPEVALTVRSARFQALQQMLEADEVELSLLWDYAWQQVDDENLEVTHLLDDPPMLLISTVHHPARRPRVDLAELAGKQWITRPTCRPHLRRRLAGLTPEDRVSVLGPCSRRKTGRICRWIGRPSFLEIAMLFRIAVAAAASVALLPVAVSQADTASTVRFASVQYNSPGRHPHQRRPQRREGQDPQLRTTTRILTGWTVRDISRHVYTFPTFKLRAGTSVLKNPRDVTIDTCRWGNGPGFTRCWTGRGCFRSVAQPAVVWAGHGDGHQGDRRANVQGVRPSAARVCVLGLGAGADAKVVQGMLHDRDIRIINAVTGELLRELVLDPTKDYQPTGKPKGPTRQQNP